MASSAQYKDPHQPIYAWLVITGILLFGLFLLWRYDLAGLILDADQTYLSLVILVLFGVTCIYLGGASWRLSQLNLAVVQYSKSSDTSALPEADEPWLHEHLTLSRGIKGGQSAQGEALHARLVEQIHRGHSLGWFAVDALIRLGLIGTVIGFILMLGAVYQLNDEDISVLQDLLGSMGAGMQVALYTTLTGISASLVLSIYCKALDRFADDLISNIIRLGASTLSGDSVVKPL